MRNLKHFTSYFQGITYKDDFGHSSEWNEEMNKWLEFAESINYTWYKNNQGRVKNDKQRDELLGEYKTLYFIGKLSHCKIIQMEPPGNNGNKNDFSFEDKKNKEWFTEVKSPSWRGEVSKKIDNKYIQELTKKLVIVDYTQDRKWKIEIECPKCLNKFVVISDDNERSYIEDLMKKTICPACKQNIWLFSEKERSQLKNNRLSKKQFSNGEARGFSSQDAVEDAIKKSVEQFIPGKNNLLVVTHNMFAGMGISMSASMEEGHSIKQSALKYDPKGIISCICLIDTYITEQGGKFIAYFIPIKGEPLIGI